jgi:hypothetical protein
MDEVVIWDLEGSELKPAQTDRRRKSQSSITMTKITTIIFDVDDTLYDVSTVSCLSTCVFGFLCVRREVVDNWLFSMNRQHNMLPYISHCLSCLLLLVLYKILSS